MLLNAPTGVYQTTGLSGTHYTVANGQIDAQINDVPGFLANGFTAPIAPATPVGASSPGTGAFTTLTSSGTSNLASAAGSRVGIGQASPTANLHIRAGSAAANNAPMKFTSGALLTTPEAGAKEFLTDDYYATITTGAARK
ncbi:MAG: hypothetical protein WCL30_05000, partial [Pseudomonadota bacterium]